MKNKLHVRALISVTAFVWALLLLYQGQSLSWGFIKSLNFIVAFMIILIELFDRWLWKFKVFYPWFVSTPVLVGSWRGQLISDWINPETNESIPPIEAFLVIHQTLSTVKVKLITRESSSNLINDKLALNNEIYEITGLYLNQPRASVRNRSEIHYGGVLLKVHQGDRLNVDGHYWTDRKTRGEMKFYRYSESTADTSFEGCENSFSKLMGDKIQINH